MILKWLFSRPVRHALQMRKHVWKLVQHQRDLLSADALHALQRAMDELRAACATGDTSTITARMAELEKAANTWLRPYPYPSLRENVEVLLVAICVAMGIRTFFLQPFKIPTGSMQPTLYGVHWQPLAEDDKIPNRAVRFVQYWINGLQYVQVKARAPGTFEGYGPATRALLFNLKQTFRVGGVDYVLWFPADNLFESLGQKRYWLNPDGTPKAFQPGNSILKLKVWAGDHLFVNRLTYNFRPPRRGEIVVFETRGIYPLPQDQFYIKRLVALGGEEVSIGNDRHLRINGRRLDARTPHFELVYSFNGPPADSQYSGHVNEAVAPKEPGRGPLAPLFPDENARFTVRPNHYLVMGDNTLNSYDSRGWGDFPRENVIGKAAFVYWPISSRFGWGYR